MEEKRTHTNPLSEEAVEQLRKNPNVKSVSCSTVKFTPEFKTFFYKERQAGKTTKEIFLSAGLDPRLFGKSRMRNYQQTLGKNSRQAGNGMKPDSRDSVPSADEDEHSPEEKICRLEHELAYVKQEVEFLKKLQMANMEAKKSWESKHRQK